MTQTFSLTGLYHQRAIRFPFLFYLVNSKLFGGYSKWEVTCDELVSHPGGSRNTPSRFIPQKPEISTTPEEPWARPITIGADLPTLPFTVKVVALLPEQIVPKFLLVFYKATTFPSRLMAYHE